jgi:hypothetical protein
MKPSPPSDAIVHTAGRLIGLLPRKERLMIKKLLRDTAGAAALEFALCLFPLTVMLTFLAVAVDEQRAGIRGGEPFVRQKS